MAPGTAVRIPARAMLRSQHSRRRRRSRVGEAPRLALPAGFRLGGFGRLYVLVAAILGAALLYLGQAAGATQSSYEIGRLQAQHGELIAEQHHLQFEEASLRSPARIEAEAAQSNLTRPNPYRYLAYQPVDVDLAGAPATAPDTSPIWQRAMAGLGRTLAHSQDALAAGR